MRFYRKQFPVYVFQHNVKCNQSMIASTNVCNINAIIRIFVALHTHRLKDFKYYNI